MEDLRKEIAMIADKMGTLVEDIVAPALYEPAEKYFGCEIELSAEMVEKQVGERR